MAELILLSIPSRVSITCVVAAPERPLTEAVVPRPRDLPDGVDCRVEEIDGRDPSLAPVISRLSCPHCSPGVDPLVPVLLERTRGHLSVTCTAPPGWAPDHLWVCAEAIELIRGLTGGIAIDVERSILLPEPWRPDHPRGPTDLRVEDWVSVTISGDGEGRYLMCTAGLSRFGLPELRAGDLREHHVPGWFHLVIGLAGVLVRRVLADERLRPRGGAHAVPAEIPVPGPEVSAAVPADAARPGAAWVRLRHDAWAGCLSLLPPAACVAGEADWRDRVAQVMSEPGEHGGV